MTATRTVRNWPQVIMLAVIAAAPAGVRARPPGADAQAAAGAALREFGVCAGLLRYA